MFAFLDNLINTMEAHLNLYTHVVVGPLLPNKSITLVSMPSSRGESYYNGQREINGLFQVLTKHADQQVAAQTIEEIAGFLENYNFQVEGYKVTKVQVYTEPHYLSGNQQSGWTYNAAFTAQIIKE